MSQNENDILRQLIEKFDDHVRETAKNSKTTMEELATIKRGIYGDPQNKVAGLIETDRDQDKRIKALEEQNKKQKWMVAGVSFSIPVIVHLVKDKLGL